ncbi:MAG: IPT/TIG domain-containing protein [Solirubrobacteraceae bacterium]
MKAIRAVGWIAGLAALLALPASAPAVVVQVEGRTLSYQAVKGAAPSQPASKPKGGQPVTYHGGPVMTSNTNYALYWAPSPLPAGASEYPAGYETGLNRYFEDVSHDSGSLTTIDSVLAQYTQNGSEPAAYDSHFGGALLDTDPYPASGCPSAPICLTDEQLRSELRSFVTAHGLPADLAHAYFILTPPGVESCWEGAGHKCSDGTKHALYCAYHSYFTLGAGVVVYAHNPYVGGTNCDPGEAKHPNGNQSDATITAGLAHEHAEAVTDPELNAWLDEKGNEVADKCRTFHEASEFGPPLGVAPNGSPYNQLIDTVEYWYQQVWSNKEAACEQRAAALPTVGKVSPKTGPLAGGTSVKISGGSFSAPATVKFGSAAAGSVKVESASSILAVSPAGAKGTVDVTVTTSAGTSSIVKQDRFKYR